MNRTFFKALVLAWFVLAAPLGRAATIYFVDQNIAIPTNFDGVYLNLVTGATSAAPAPGAHINLFFGGAGISNDADAGAATPSLQFLRVGGSSLDAARNSTVGASISAVSQVFSTGYGSSGSPNSHLGAAPPQFVDGQKGYLGFTFDLAGNPVFGFMEVTLTANGAGVIHAWQYENTGQPVTVAPIPEPSAALLALAATALAVFRRRRPN